MGDEPIAGRTVAGLAADPLGGARVGAGNRPLDPTGGRRGERRMAAGAGAVLGGRHDRQRRINGRDPGDDLRRKRPMKDTLGAGVGIVEGPHRVGAPPRLPLPGRAGMAPRRGAGGGSKRRPQRRHGRGGGDERRVGADRRDPRVARPEDEERDTGEEGEHHDGSQEARHVEGSQNATGSGERCPWPW